MLTLFVIKGNGKYDPIKAMVSFGDIVRYTKVLEDRRIDHIPVDTEWYGYIYSDEWIDKRIKDALPVFLKAGYFDCLILMKKQLDTGKLRAFKAPRIFRREVKLEKNMLIPKHPKRLTFETLLDGWIRGNDTN